MSYPNLAIGIITYNRPREFEQVFHAFLDNIIYPGEITFVLSDDGSKTDYISQYQRARVITLHHNRVGMPGNWNAMIAECEKHADYTLCCQDDWLLTERLDLRLGVAFLMHNRQYGMVRYHKTTGHKGLIHNIQEWDTRGKVTGVSLPNENIPEMLPYFDLMPPVKNPFYPSEDNNLNSYSPYSGGVHLRHKRFTACYGEYRTGAGFSDAEYEFWCRVNDGLRDNPDVVQRVALFPHYIQSRFKELGTSYRGTAVEKETVR